MTMPAEEEAAETTPSTAADAERREELLRDLLAMGMPVRTLEAFFAGWGDSLAAVLDPPADPAEA